MTYWYILKVIAYPFLIWGTVFLSQDQSIGFGFLLIAMLLMIIEDVISWQEIRELKFANSKDGEE